MGERNSTVTRVWPVFDRLLSDDPSGTSWFPAILRMGSLLADAAPEVLTNCGALLPEVARFELSIPAPVAKALGPERASRLGFIRNCFERELPPSADFLGWLLENPQHLVWPRESATRARTFGPTTQENRQKLVAGDKAVQRQSLSELDRVGIDGSKRKWWAFEGFTSVDCLLETDTLVLLIEGKRTETISNSTDWYPQRNQVLRNLDCAREMGRRKNKQFGVLLCAEKPMDIPETAWSQSLPHLSKDEVQELKRHYLGCVTWSDIVAKLCPDLRLPDTIDEAVDFCVSLRRAG